MLSQLGTEYRDGAETNAIGMRTSIQPPFESNSRDAVDLDFTAFGANLSARIPVHAPKNLDNWPLTCMPASAIGLQVDG